MTETKSKKSGCGCLPLLLISALGIGAGYYYGRDMLGKELTPKDTAKIVPASTLVTAHISTNPSQWSQLSQFGTPTAQKIVNDGLQSFLDENINENSHNINIEKDILPWAGGAGIAVFPSPETKDYQSIAIIGIKNKVKAYLFFRDFKEKRGEKLIETKYQNISIFQLKSEDSMDLWLSVFNNLVVISDEEATIKKVIDTYKGGESLALNYPKKSLSSDSLISLYFPDYLQLLGSNLNDILGESGSELQNKWIKVNSLTTDVFVENHGLTLKTRVNLSEPITVNNTPIKPVSQRLLSHIPENSIFLMTGGQINQVWEEIEAEKKQIPELNDAINEVQNLTRQWLNLDLNKDVFGWLNGEFAFALSVNPNQPILDNNLSGLILIETSDRTQGNQTLQTLENTARFLPFISLRKAEQDKINIVEWQNLNRTLVSYGWLDDRNLLLTLGRGISGENINPSSSIINNPTFKNVTESLTKNNYGYVYFDIEKTLELASTIEPTFEESLALNPEINAFLQSVSAIALTSSSIDNVTNEVELNIALKRK